MIGEVYIRPSGKLVFQLSYTMSLSRKSPYIERSGFQDTAMTMHSPSKHIVSGLQCFFPSLFQDVLRGCQSVSRARCHPSLSCGIGGRLNSVSVVSALNERAPYHSRDEFSTPESIFFARNPKLSVSVGCGCMASATSRSVAFMETIRDASPARFEAPFVKR